MRNASPFSDYAARLRQFMAKSLEQGLAPDSEFNALALELFELQFRHNPVARHVWESSGAIPDRLSHWTAIPAFPTSAFKEWMLTCIHGQDGHSSEPPGNPLTINLGASSPHPSPPLGVEERVPERAGEEIGPPLRAHVPPNSAASQREQYAAVFHSSGTTEQRPSRHFHDTESLSLYENSLWPWFQKHLFSDDAAKQLRVIALTPSPERAPHSSLVHMLDTVGRRSTGAGFTFAGTTDIDGAWKVDSSLVQRELEAACDRNRPVLIMGTAFNFVHFLEDLASSSLKLPIGSRVMETGGYKGRSRALPKDELHNWIQRQLGVGAEQIICEYGMCELSSQAYDQQFGQAGRRRLFRFPPWARAQIISPETGCEVEIGETGLVRILDLANLKSVLAVQTEDLAIRHEVGFELLGRAAYAEPRGCSLAPAER